MILIKTKAIARRPFAVLDIGSSKICCMIGEADGAGGVRLLGHGTHASAGIRSGEVSELEALSAVIGKTVQAAERDSGISVTSVTVVAPGGTPFSSICKKSVKLSDAVVRRRDERTERAPRAPPPPPPPRQPLGRLRRLRFRPRGP